MPHPYTLIQVAEIHRNELIKEAQLESLKAVTSTHAPNQARRSMVAIFLAALPVTLWLVWAINNH